MQATLRKYRRTLLFLTRLILVAAMTGIFGVSWLCFFDATNFYFNGYILFLLVYVAVFTAFATIYSVFKIGTLRLAEVVWSTMLALLLTNALAYLQLSLFALRLLSPWPLLLTTLVQIMAAALLSYYTNKVYFYLYPAREMAIICRDKRQALELADKLSLIREKYRVCRMVSQEEGMQAVDAAIDSFQSLMIYNIDPALRRHILDRGFAAGKRIYIIPDAHDIMLNTAGITQIFDTPVLLCKNAIMTTEQALLKRGFDMLISAVGLLLSSPLMLLVALAIKLQDGGPVLYRQQRLTRGDRVFTLYKFRSMVVDAEGDGVARLAAQEDARITPVGRLIRATRLDELPQLLNVLRGDMSIVGPRPERPEIARQYIGTLPDFAYRTRVKAGLTGYAQVYGKYNTTPEDKLLLDLLYLENYSLLLDFKLLLLTAKILFLPGSTEGVDNGRTTAQK